MATFNWTQLMRYLHWWRNCKFGFSPQRQLFWTPVPLFILFLMSIYAEPSPLSEIGTTEPAVLLAVGDIANCAFPYHEETAALVDELPGTIAMLGDAVYKGGTYEYFMECYDTSWGRHKERTRPAPGNHEYDDEGAGGYFRYFGDLASPQQPGCVIHCKGYYSYDLGPWHIIALNSEINMSAGSPQEQWLRADLEANRRKCTLAYWHRPLYSSGDHGNDDRSMDVWRVLYHYGVDVVLNGHEHSYERFAPQHPTGHLNEERGIRQFVVGTGGVPFRKIDTPRKHSEVHNHRVWGVLQLTLHEDSFDWEFKSIKDGPLLKGYTFEDSGSDTCVILEGDE